MSWPVEADLGEEGGLEAGEDLLLFGYAAKIFRDDEKAEWIEEGKHLIPWMGDPAVLIDRYDGRGAITDLKTYEPSGFHQTTSIHDLEMDRLCEEERYRDLREDQEFHESSAYQEAEFVALQRDISGIEMRKETRGAAIEFTYDNSSNNGISKPIGPSPRKLREDAKYYQPSGLKFPIGMTLPKTMKSHAIIEKTAKFIGGQGSQMEIILKTKQSGNPLFNFLNFSDALNPYYKFLVSVIKTGAYKPSLLTNYDDSPVEEDGTDDGESSETEDSYLHPSLFKSSQPSEPLSLPNYKGGGPSAYTMLVSKIRGVVGTTSPEPDPNAIPLDPTVPTHQDLLVIEKMANYVVKNGSDFEVLARTKGDPRFLFLNSDHPHHSHYEKCKDEVRVEAEAVVATGDFVSYRDTKPATPVVPPSTMEVIEIPTTSLTSASGSSLVIPIANLASIQNRKMNISAELVSRVEELRRKVSNEKCKELRPSRFSLTSPNNGESEESERRKKEEKSKQDQIRRQEDSIRHQEEANQREKNRLAAEELKKTELADIERKRKEERKRKATIFLQQLKIQSAKELIVKEVLEDLKNVREPQGTFLTAGECEGMEQVFKEESKDQIDVQLQSRLELKKKRTGELSEGELESGSDASPVRQEKRPSPSSSSDSDPRSKRKKHRGKHSRKRRKKSKTSRSYSKKSKKRSS